MFHKNPISYLLLALAFALFTPSRASAQEYEWARQIVSNYESWVFDLTVDGSGNVISVGRFSGIIDLDPGPGTFNVSTPVSSFNTFIQKLDSNGQFLWGGSISSPDFNAPSSVMTDATGNIYLVGYIQKEADFDIGTGIDSAGCTPGGTYLMRLSSSGQYQWVRTIDNIWLQQESGHVTVMDSASNIYLAGKYTGTVDFDPGPGVHNLYGSFQSSFVGSYDSTGALNWVFGMGGSVTVASNIALDGTGIYVAGTFGDTIDFDPGPGTVMLDDSNNAYHDLFIAHYSFSGALLSVSQVVVTDFFWIYGIEADGNGGITVCGSFQDTVDLDPGPGVDLHSSTGLDDLFLIKLGPNGSYQWGKTVASNGGFVEGRCIAHDTDGNVYVALQFNGTADFDPGPGVFSVQGMGGYDVAMLKLDAAGDFVLVAPVAGLYDEHSNTVRVDGNANIYMGGNFYQTVDFAPLPSDTALLTTLNDVEGFVLKWSQDSCTNFIVRIDSTVNVSCTNTAGSLNGTALGGIRPYSYSWNTVPATLDSVAIPHSFGIYTLTAIDSIGCQATRSALINGPSVISGFDLEDHQIIVGFRPNQLSPIYMDVSNQGCATTAGQLRLTLDPQVSVDALFPVPNLIVGDTLWWNVPPMNYDSAHFIVWVSVLTDSTAQLGDTVYFNSIVTPTVGDTEPSDNVQNDMSIVTNAYDPNQKSVYPIGACPEHYVFKSDPLTYTIQFQNSGTAEALEVAILDTLDPYLDLATVTIKGNSHPMVTEVLPGNVLRFAFHNIHLPDSNTDEPASHGYVIFEVQPILGIPSGTEVRNGSAIYFDFNAPVLTNVVMNTLVDVIPACAVGSDDPQTMPIEYLRVYPNPATRIVNIESDRMLGDVVVIDLMGKVLWAQDEIRSRSVAIPLADWVSGLYFVRVGNRSPMIRKLIVE